jgi:hypothetical protein
MTCWIEYGDRRVTLNNMQFAELIEWAIEVGRRTAATTAERNYVNRMAQLDKEEF